MILFYFERTLLVRCTDNFVFSPLLKCRTHYYSMNEELSSTKEYVQMSFHEWMRTVLYCTVLYCTVLNCTVLYCTVLYCTVLYCTVLYCTVLYCTVLYFTLLYFTVL